MESDEKDVHFHLKVIYEHPGSKLSIGYSPKNDESDKYFSKSEWRSNDDPERHYLETLFEGTDEL